MPNLAICLTLLKFALFWSRGSSTIAYGVAYASCGVLFILEFRHFSWSGALRYTRGILVILQCQVDADIAYNEGLLLDWGSSLL